jgi:hypothetical protein
MEYYVDKERLETFVKDWKRSQWLRFVIIFSICLIWVVAVAQYSKTEIPARVYLIMIPISCAAFFLGITSMASDMRRFAGSRYFLDLSSGTIRSEGVEPRSFAFGNIIKMDRNRYGTVLVKGKRLFGLRFPNRRRRYYHFRNSDILFIPSVTSNYEELISRIKDLTA